jgi:hypothetical protein
MESTLNRVPNHTSSDINRRIRREMEERLLHFQNHPEEIDDRLKELEEEWDIERTIEANASTLALGGLILGLTTDRKWLGLPVVVTGFLLQHAIQGWCPPVPILRRLGFRTSDEINQERYALKALRGDFDLSASTGSNGRLAAILQIVGLRKRPAQTSSASHH